VIRLDFQVVDRNHLAAVHDSRHWQALARVAQQHVARFQVAGGGPTAALDPERVLGRRPERLPLERLQSKRLALS
jgi:hypothetical protein